MALTWCYSRCQKILPIATAAYQEGLPQHYTYSLHFNQVRATLFEKIWLKYRVPVGRHNKPGIHIIASLKTGIEIADR